ncbi:hypothetical protein NLI96_g13090 [Meripilus lineatus]|uniref:Uncharacterized protein n=1 Tax=Meripilus lineatus TaxID=2056292 RepID=A0AAD5Y7L6_9APHY|nr:hypothetical protein NLI96_g13090 [Physisporinus lineatus]
MEFLFNPSFSSSSGLTSQVSLLPPLAGSLDASPALSLNHLGLLPPSPLSGNDPLASRLAPSTPTTTNPVHAALAAMPLLEVITYNREVRNFHESHQECHRALAKSVESNSALQQDVQTLLAENRTQQAAIKIYEEEICTLKAQLG